MKWNQWKKNEHAGKEEYGKDMEVEAEMKELKNGYDNI